MSDTGQILLDTFDCIQIINLKSRPDRLREMEVQLRRIDLSLDHPKITILEASRFEEKGGFESVGARGCFHSHLRAMEAARERSCRNTLILEDDCNFLDSENRFIDAFDRLGRTNWSIFYGGYDGEFIQSPSVAPNSLLLIDPNTPVRTTHFLALTREASNLAIPYLQKILTRPPGSPEGGPMHVDGAYSWFRAAHPHLETWAAIPVLGYQRPSRTDIHDLKFYDKIPIIREFVGVMRSIRHRRHNLDG